MPFNYRQEYNRYRLYYTRILPKIKSEKTGLYLTVVLSLFTSAFFLAFAIRPTLNTIISLQKKIEDGKNLNQQMSAKLINLSRAQSQLLTYQKQVKILDSLLPNHPQLQNLINELETLGSRANIKIVSFNVNRSPLGPLPNLEERAETEESSKQTLSQLQEVTFSLRVQGDYHALENFVKELNRLSRILTLEQARIEVEERQPLNLLISGKTYYYLEKISRP